MEDIFTEFLWKWRLPLREFEESILMDGSREWLTFFQAYNELEGDMPKILGDQPLNPGKFHFWTIFIEELIDAEILIGVSVDDPKSGVSGDTFGSTRLGLSENSWVIGNNGCVSNNSRRAVRDVWKFHQKDLISVYLNYPDKKLSFAINGNHLGVEFTNIPDKCALFPVIGVSGICSLRLCSTYESSYSLELRALLAHTYFVGSSKCGKSSKKLRIGKNLKQYWRKPKPLKNCINHLPVGLLSLFERKYPWFFERNIRCTKTKFSYFKPKTCLFHSPKAAALGPHSTASRFRPYRRRK